MLYSWTKKGKQKKNRTGIEQYSSARILQGLHMITNISIAGWWVSCSPPSWSRKRVEGCAGGWAPQGWGSCSKRSCSWMSKERRGGEAIETVWGKVLQLVLSNWKFTEPDRDSYICHTWIILLAHEHICLIKLQLGWANCRSGSCVQSAWYYDIWNIL